MLKRIFFILTLILIQSIAFSQKIQNLDYYSSENNVIITYDLNQCNSNNLYDITVIFVEEVTKKILYPKSISGEILEVSCGENKKIIWDVKNDYNSVSGKFYPVIDFKLRNNSSGSDDGIMTEQIISQAQKELAIKVEPLLVSEVIENFKNEYLNKNLFNYEVKSNIPSTVDGKCYSTCEISISLNSSFVDFVKNFAIELSKVSNSIVSNKKFSFEVYTKNINFSNPKSIDLLNKFCDYLEVEMNDFVIQDYCYNQLNYQIEKQTIFFQNSILFNENNGLAKKIKTIINCNVDNVASLNQLNVQNSKSLKKNIDYRTKEQQFKFSELSPINYQNLNTSILGTLNYISSLEKSGKINFVYNIKFNENGQNLSSFKSSFFSINKYESVLTNKINQLKIPPLKLCDNFAAINEDLSCEYVWETKTYIYKYRGVNIQSDKNYYLIDKNLNSKPLYGDYEIMEKNIVHNGKTVKDISVTNLKIRGPINSLYSLIIPGWGLRRITYSNKSGWGRFLMVSLPFAASFLSANLSNNNYTRYLNATEHDQIQFYYNKANFWNKSKYIIGSIGVTFYVYDFVDVIYRGVKNINKKNKLKFPL